MKMLVVISHPQWFFDGDYDYSMSLIPEDSTVPEGWIALHTVDIDTDAINHGDLANSMIDILDRKAEEERAKFAKVMAEIDAAKANLLALPAGEVA